MAVSRARRNINCFYCGFRSNKKQDGTIRRWECPRCEAANYFDENGEITDPPVATVEEVPMTVQFARPRSTSPIHMHARPSSPSSSSIFCDKCLKNQHLFTACLAQYCPEGEDANEFEPLNKEYYQFRRMLEERYPQVCEECEPKVLAQMRQAGYTAKTDHLRRLMQQTRARKVPTKGRRRELSFSTFMDDTGRWLWWLGVLGQLIWHVTVLVKILGLGSYLVSFSQLPGVHLVISTVLRVSKLIPFASSLRELSILYCDSSSPFSENAVPVAARWSIISSVIALYWNPRLSEAVRGFTGHISGYKEWYTFQILTLGVRLMFKSMHDRGVFVDLRQAPTIAAHSFILIFLSTMYTSARRNLKTNLTPLFASTPERLRPAKQPLKAPNRAPRTMFEALDDILAPSSQPATASPIQQRVETTSQQSLGSPPQLRQPPPLEPSSPSLGLELPRSMPSLVDMSREEALHYMKTGDLPARLQQTANEDDEMDWAPTQQSSYRAFAPVRPRNDHLPQTFNSSPAVPEQESSPFWYKLPPAPVAPAQKLRNPPNKAHFQSAPPVVKENFFQSLRRRKESFGTTPEPEMRPDKLFKGLDILDPTIPSPSPVKRRRVVDIDIAQPKFFPPSKDDDGLTDLFGKSFSLKSDDDAGEGGTDGDGTGNNGNEASAVQEIVQTVGGVPLVTFGIVFLGIATAIFVKGTGASVSLGV